MSKPISFETVLTRRRLVEEVQAIEDEIARMGVTSTQAIAVRTRDLRLALEHKPIDIDPQ